MSQFFFNFVADCHNIHNFIFSYDCRIYHIVWPRSDENCRRSSVLKFSAPYVSVLTKISKCHQILADRQKQLQPEFPPDQHTYNKLWLKLNENYGSSSLLKILKFCKVHRMTPNQTQGIRHQKYPTYVHCSTPSPKFSFVSLYDQPFSRYCTF